MKGTEKQRVILMGVTEKEREREREKEKEREEGEGGGERKRIESSDIKHGCFMSHSKMLLVCNLIA